MNRRGSLTDGPYIIVELFVFAILTVVALKVLVAFNDALIPVPGIDVAQSILLDATTKAPQVFDAIFGAMFVGLPLISAILAGINAVPPFFFFVLIGYALFQIVLGKALEIAYTGLIAGSAEISTISSSMPILNYVMTHYAIYSYLVIVIIAIGTFVKINGQNDIVGGIQ